MRRTLLCLLPALCLLTACKKDLLRWESAERAITGTDRRINDLIWLNDSTAIAVGGERFNQADILRSTDSGKTWQRFNSPDAGKALYGVTRTPWNALYTIGFDGKLLRSTDEGQSWTFSQLLYLPFKKIAFADPDHGLVVGGVSFDQGYLSRIDAQGRYQGFDSVGYELNDLLLVRPNLCFLAAFGTVLRSTDTFRSWQHLDILEDNFTALYRDGTGHLYTCGANGSVYRSDNDGNHWKRLRNGADLRYPRYQFLDLLFTDERHGYCVGEDGLVAYTDDAGDHWMEFDRFTDARLRSITRRADGRLVIAGDRGEIWIVRPKAR